MDIANLHNLTDRDLLIHIATNVAALRDTSEDHEKRIRGAENELARIGKSSEDQEKNTKKHLAMGAIAATIGVQVFEWAKHLIAGK